MNIFFTLNVQTTKRSVQAWRMTLHVLRPMTARQNESSPIIIPWHSGLIGGKLRHGSSFIGQPRQNIQQEWPRLLVETETSNT